MWNDRGRLHVVETSPEPHGDGGVQHRDPHAEAVGVSDMTPGGVRLAGSALPTQETRVLLRVRDTAVPGRVAWSGGTECGIAFDQALSPEDWERLRRESRASLTRL